MISLSRAAGAAHAELERVGVLIRHDPRDHLPVFVGPNRRVARAYLLPAGDPVAGFGTDFLGYLLEAPEADRVSPILRRPT